MLVTLYCGLTYSTNNHRRSMKHKILQALSIALLCLLGYACQRADIASGDSLEVMSADFVRLEATGASLQMEVRSNRSDWGLIKNAEWLSAQRLGENIILSAPANTSSEERTAELIVVAGKTQRKLLIEQSAAPMIVDTESDHQEVSFMGATLLTAIDTNIPDWRITTDADWVGIRLLPRSSQVELTVSPHQGRSPREAKLLVVDQHGRVGRELTISQQAMPYHLLPYSGYLEGDLPIRNFEFARGGTLTLLPDNFFNHYQWRFSTVSPAFNSISYSIVKGQYVISTVYATRGDLFADLSELEDQRQFLLRNGFTELKENVYYNATMQVRAKIIVGDGYDRVLYCFHPKQVAPQPTLSTIPAHFAGQTVSLDQVRAWEAEHGGTYNESKSSINTRPTSNSAYFFDVDGRDDVAARFYYVSNKTKVVTEYAVCYSNIQRVYQLYNGDLFYSDEFVELLEREGYGYPVPQGENARKYSYKHSSATGGFSIVTNYIKYRSIPVPVAEIRILWE